MAADGHHETSVTDLEREPARTRRRRLGVIGGVVAVAVLATGTWMVVRPGADPAATVIDRGPTGRSAIARLAALVPDEVQTTVILGDVALARDQAGMVPPPPDASTEEVDEFLLELARRGYWPIDALQPLLSSAARVSNGLQPIRDELGIEPAHITGAAQWQLESRPVIVLEGSFDPARVEAAARALPPPWGDALTIEEHRGVRYFSWFPDHEIDVTRPTAVNGLGVAQRWAVVGDLFVITRETAAVEATIDAILDGRRSRAAELVSTIDPRRFAVVVWQSQLADGTQVWWEGSSGDDRSGEADEWLVRVLADGPSSESRLRHLPDDAAALNGWPPTWREHVSTRVEGAVVTFVVAANDVTRADHPDLSMSVGDAMAWDLGSALRDPP